MAIIQNTSGDDTLIGTEENDVFNLITGSGPNPLPGDNNGFDLYDGLGGYNRIVGGWSYDVLRVSNNLANLVNIHEIDGGDNQPGYNTILATSGNDTLDFSGYVIKSFVIDGGAGNDTITGTAGNDHIRGGAGNDVLNGGDGDDRFLLVTGGSGDNSGLDHYDGGNGHNRIVGGWSYDVLRVSNNLANLVNIQEIDGGDGQTGYNTILATANHDRLDFSGYVIRNFVIDGAGGNDTITGTDGDDHIRGGSGGDALYGGEGSDTYLVGKGDGADAFLDTGTSGTDRILATASGVSIGVSALSGIELISANGWTGVNVVGTANHQLLDFSNTTFTGIGIVDALGGDDVIHTSNLTAQTYRGGSGHDRFVLGEADTVLRVSAADNGGFDSFSGNGSATHRLVAENANTQIGIGALYGGDRSVDVIDGNGKANVTIVGSNSSHDVWDLSATQLIGIEEVQTGVGNDTIHAANDSDAAGGQAYRGGKGNDLFHLGTADTRLLVSAEDNGGFDNFRGNSDAALHSLIVEGAGAQIGIGTSYGGANSVDVIDGGTETAVIVGSSSAHDVWDFSGTLLSGITSIGTANGNDRVQTALSANVDSHVTYDGGAGNGDRLVISLTAAQASNTTLLNQIAALTPGALNGTLNAAGVSLTARNFENFEIAVQNGDGFTILDADNILRGGGGSDSNLFVESHPGGAGRATAESWIVLGFGGNDTMGGSNGDDILIGGTGTNTMSGFGGDDVFLVGDNNNSGVFDGGAGHDRILATADGTVIGLAALNALVSIEEISGGGYANVRVNGTGSTTNPDVLDFREVVISGIAEINAVAGNDVIHTSNLSAASYRGGNHNDTFHLGDADATLLYGNISNGADTFTGNTIGDSTVHTILADADNTTIGLAGGFANGVDVIDGGGFANVRVTGTSSADTLDFSEVAISGISEINGGSFNDRIIVSSSVDASAQIIYDGGAHTDTLVLMLTADQMADDALQAEIADLVNGNGIVDTGGFNFLARNFEALEFDLLA